MPDTTPTKDDLLAALAVERRYWEALVAAVQSAGLMDRPGANNESWTFREMAAHLNAWRGQTVARLQAGAHNTEPPAPPWPAGLTEETNVDAINAWFAERDRERPASDVLAEATTQFAAMDAAIVATPAAALLTPGRFAWLHEYPLGPALLGFSFAHLHIDHDPDIRVWLRRETGRELALPPAPTTFGYGD